MNWLKKIYLPFCFLVICALLYSQLFFWHLAWLGWALFFCYMFVCGEWWQMAMCHVFGFKRKWWMTRVIAWFVVIILFSFFTSVMVAWYHLTPFVIWVGLVLCGLMSYALTFFTRKVHVKTGDDDAGIFFATPVFSKRWIFVLVWLGLWCAGLVLLWRSSATGAPTSPWQAIAPAYLPIFFALTVLTGAIIFSHFNSRVVLFLILLQTLLLHLYLPLSHVNPWGGDVWRHIAVENRIVDGKYILPVLFGPEVKSRDVGDFYIPEVLLSPQKYAYGQMWGLSAALATVLQVDLVRVNMWLMPILWSLALPILLFRIGWLLFQSRRSGLFLAFLSFLPFPFQALGSLTLPVSLGYLVFFFVLMLWLSYLEMHHPWQKYLTFGFAVLMLFGYPLQAVLMWFIIIVSLVLKHSKKKPRLTTAIIAFVAIGLFPAIEMLSHVSFLPKQVDWFAQVTQFAGQWSGWYYASLIRPHDISSGNIIFNHTPVSSFVANAFTAWRWYIIPSMFFLWGCAVYGWGSIWRRDERLVWRVFAVVATTVIGGYVIGWYVLVGDRLFTRRLDAMVAFVLLVFFMKALTAARGYDIRDTARRVLALLFVLWVSWFATATYASGPDMRVVSNDEVQAAQYVWDREQKDAPNHCVLADTWMLLPLESMSGGALVGGNFPIDYQFGQPERLELMNAISSKPFKDILTSAQNLTQSERCMVVLKKSLLTEEKIKDITATVGSDPQSFGDLLVWQEGLKKKPN